MTALALVGLAFGVGYAVANIHRRTPPMSLLELLFGGEPDARTQNTPE